MKAKELIEILNKYDDNAEVLIYKGQGNIEIVKSDNIEYDRKTNEVIIT